MLSKKFGGLESQIKKLEEYGCEKIFKEQVSGTSTEGREQLRECLNFVREKDELVSRESIYDLNNRLKSQKGIEVAFSEIKNANHFFKNKEEELKKIINSYVQKNTELI